MENSQQQNESTTNFELIIEKMNFTHLPRVMEIENLSYPNPWSLHTFLNEIQQNHLSYYVVAKINEEVVGYAGLWLIMEEVHLTNIAVHPDWRQKKTAEKLLMYLILEAKKRSFKWMTLEVRESNTAAKKLYEKFKFKVMGRREKYYIDNNEAALIMWSENLQDENYIKNLFLIAEKNNLNNDS